MGLFSFVETLEVQITDKKYRYTDEKKHEDEYLYICMSPFVICTSNVPPLTFLSFSRMFTAPIVALREFEHDTV
ncbi:hypothetical protein A2318_04590 [Candidatus Uhrbacteria bacterium RIFOXYB2_FULL_45_11]|uniref:Uncharacterized protein n=1 Tax=Candidatus Uhrbacteria bacterium RIFOXYB2_FULL_45_11 TaxID=1802421 RepID=A0A1F7W762_9BACT|nr:MAG: hypothetical protein A2318_04590 [Candidatus Uhrbacteria bacterium RIFOXYB2_FULL_45_11]